MRDIIARVESSWKNWRKKIQFDLDPTSFSSHRQYMHRNVGNLVGFALMVLFQM